MIQSSLKTSLQRSLQISAIAMLVASITACSGTPKPRTEMALSNSALQNAEVAGASKHAPIELRTAQEKQSLADSAYSKEKFTTAKMLSEQAAVDAEFAKAKSEAQKSRLALEEVEDSIQLIRTELDRTSD